MRFVLELLFLGFTLAGAETLHGILRNAVVAPRLGTKKAKQVSLISGTLILFAICYFWIPSLGIDSVGGLLAVGLFLAIFMGLFDVVLGRYLMKLRWKMVLRDFDLRQGNYLLVGLLILSGIPLMVMKLRA
ncbi:hypothetical protein [Nodosilinea nodulosa]|uniref:hypothetical protein n=1 Tax=Nodosilinea nodulosa TaxID=416001 RepID=UPI0002EB5792|nr:hypothetical protein [Nodosilinea nodulosa]